MTIPLRLITASQQQVTLPARHNAELARDAIDLFQERRAGHMSKWLYSTPLFPGDRANGAEIWASVVTEAKQGSPYYVFHAEQNMIRSSSARVQPFFDRPTRLIDLGPGSADAIDNKVMPILKAGGSAIGEYVSVDICHDTAADAASHVGARMNIKTSYLHRNFFEDRFCFGPQMEQEAVAFFGLTLFNMAVDPRVTGLSHRLLESYLMRLRSHSTATRSLLLITQDTNQNVESLRAAYFAIGPYFMPLLHLLQRDLAITGDYDPDEFSLDVDYFPETQALSICFIASRDMQFQIGGTPCAVKANDRFYFHNAFKFDIETFLGVARSAGMNILETISTPQNPCVLHILKVF